MKEEIIKIIDKCNVVSFDIFDTLILRNVFNPTDLFKILSSYVYDEFGIEKFEQIRVECEKECRNIKNNYECNIDEIYDCILTKIRNKKTIMKIKEKELALEMEFCVSNPFMKDIFKYCHKRKKKVILISDMYLKEKFILDILKKEGYSNFDIFVSCEHHHNKGTGELFDIVYKKYKIPKDEWVHIGDNTHSDYQVPIQFGIMAYNYKKVSTYTKLKPNSIFESIMLGIQCNYLYNGSNLDYWDIFGAKYISMIYFGFTKWLYDMTKNENNLFFIARDGYIINEIYNKFNIDKKVFTKYLYCSRKSVQIPSMILESKDKMLHFLTQDVGIELNMTLEEYLKNAQVDLNEIKDFDLIKAFGFKSLNDKITKENQRDAEKLAARLYNNIFKNLYPKKDLAISYLEQEGVNNFDHINIMDVGWGGSIQESISRILNKEVTGYYFGTIDLKKRDSFCNMFGYYFDLDYPKVNKEEVYNYVMMYELIFSAPHGSTIGYYKKNGKIIPKLSGDIKYNEIVGAFQNSAMKMVEEYCKYLNYFDNVDRRFCLKQYQTFLKQYQIEDMEKFHELSNDFIIGSSRVFKYVNTIKLEDIYHNPSKFLKDVSKSLWKNAFLIEHINDKNIYVRARNKLNLLINQSINMEPLKCVKIYLDYGKGFSEENILTIPYEKEGNLYHFELNLDDDSICGIRIDPIEGHYLKMNKLMINTNNGNAKCHIPRKNILKGKIKKGIYIYSKDPKIILKNAKEIKWIDFYSEMYVIK